MRKIRRYKLVQLIVFILIASSLGIITSNLETLQLVLQDSKSALENDIIVDLIKGIKTVRIVAIILWGLLMGLYSNFIYSINNERNKKTNVEI